MNGKMEINLHENRSYTKVDLEILDVLGVDRYKIFNMVVYDVEHFVTYYNIFFLKFVYLCFPSFAMQNI